METKRYLKISSKGEIDPKSFYLIGASTKRDSFDKIGKFGSGLKYAISYLLREDIPFIIYSGYRKINVTTKEETFKDKTFKVIVINGQETSITTEMGPGWKAWMAIREILANAVDEGNYSVSIVNENEIVPEEDNTCFFIQINEKIKDEVISDWNRYFLYNLENVSTERKPLFIIKNSSNTIKVYEKLDNKTRLYKEGFMVYEEAIGTLFDYEYSDITLNELRLAQYPYAEISSISKQILSCAPNMFVIELFFKTLATKIDTNLLEWGIETNNINPQIYEFFKDKCIVQRETAGYFLEEIQKLPVNKVYYLRDNLYYSIVNNIPEQYKDKIMVLGRVGNAKQNQPFYRVVEDELAKKYIDKALEILKQCEYKVEYPIEIARFDNIQILGYADISNKKILLSNDLKNKGLFQTVATIIEENEHLITEFSDESRELQTRLFEMFTRELLLRHNIIL